MDSQRTSKPKIPKNSLRTNFPVSSPSSKKDITAPAMGKSLNRSNLRKVNNVPLDTLCPLCGAPHEYIYDNCGDHRQFKFKLCWQTFPLLSSKVFTADVHFNQSNTASTSVSINTSVTTALTIKSNLKKLPMDPPLGILEIQTSVSLLGVLRRLALSVVTARKMAPAKAYPSGWLTITFCATWENRQQRTVQQDRATGKFWKPT